MVVFHLPFLAELFGNVGFSGEGRTGKKLLAATKERTNNKLYPHLASRPGFEPGSAWWEASALTTAPSLLLKTSYSETMAKH